MTEVVFTANASGEFSGGGVTCRCVLGKGGVAPADQKREGDGVSPAGIWPLRRVFYRADRVERPQTELVCIPLTPNDGWCDAPGHRLYNRPVSLPFTASHEKMWREDHVYDVVVELGHNDSPVRDQMGSAVFWHLARPDFAPTEGCVAIELEAMLRALKVATPGCAIEITQ